MMLSVAEIAVCMRQARRDAIRRRVYEDVYSRPIFAPVEPIIRNARLELRYRELLAEPIHARTAATWYELDEIEDSIMRLGRDPADFWFKRENITRSKNK